MTDKCTLCGKEITGFKGSVYGTNFETGKIEEMVFCSHCWDRHQDTISQMGSF